jgi:hypothetical protein
MYTIAETIADRILPSIFIVSIFTTSRTVIHMIAVIMIAVLSNFLHHNCVVLQVYY